MASVKAAPDSLINPARPLAPSVDDAISAIRAYVRYRGWNRYRLAKEARIGLTTLRHFYLESWSPKADTLRVLYALIPPDFDPATAPEKRPDSDQGNC